MKSELQDGIQLLAETLGELKGRLDRATGEAETQAKPLEAAEKALGAALAGLDVLKSHLMRSDLRKLGARIEEVRSAIDQQVSVVVGELKSADAANAKALGDTVRELRAEGKALEKQFGQLTTQLSKEISRVELAAKNLPVLAGKDGRSLNPAGKWDANKKGGYAKGDVVSYLGSSYISLVDDNTEKPGPKAKGWMLNAGGARTAGFYGGAAGPGITIGAPSATTDNAIVRWDGTTGQLVQNSVLTVADTTGAIAGFGAGAGITLSGGGTVTGSAGAITLAASGTNQNITLTPSGTGLVKIGSSAPGIFATTSDAADNVIMSIGGGGARSETRGAFASFYGNEAASKPGIIELVAGSVAGGHIDFYTAGSLRTRIDDTTGNLLLGGLTTDGTGVLQFPAATTSAGGITFGAEINAFRSGTAVFDWASGGANAMEMRLARTTTTSGAGFGLAALDFLNGATVASQIYSKGNGATDSGYLEFFTKATGTSLALALTLDSSQNATLGGGLLRLAGATSSFPALKRSSATLQTRLADDSADAALSALSLTATNGVHAATVTGTGASSYGGIAPITLYAKSVTVLTAGAPADVATITIPAGITRWGVYTLPDSGYPGGFAVAETAAGTLIAASFEVYTAAAGGGTQVVSETSGPTGAGNFQPLNSSGGSIVSTATSLHIRQTAASANAGTVSFYLTIFPLP